MADRWRVICADCLSAMREMPEASVDSIVTDPPYGLAFMGKHWDHGVPGVAFWTEALRVAKPGAHLLAFGGTRTFHRLAVAIEDAGWEIRDTIMWAFGSGFPKSLNLSGERRGWGTALKPAVEFICVAQKPLAICGLCGKLALTIGEQLCLLKSSAKAAGTSSPSSPSERAADADSALWRAVPQFNTPGDLFALMDTWPSGLAMPTSLSIASSWLAILAAISSLGSTFTTETESSLTTDLRILNSLSSKSIADSIIAASSRALGTGSSVSLAESIFAVVSAKLDLILTPSAPGLATSRGDERGLRPDWRPIIVARKPLARGLTVAANVLRYGTGAINVDGCRVGYVGPEDAAAAAAAAAEMRGKISSRNTDGWGMREQSIDRADYLSGSAGLGRWPANVCHDGSPEVLAGFPSEAGGCAPASRPTLRGGNSSVARGNFNGLQEGVAPAFHAASGSAARFFYTAKASREDREAGLREAATRTGCAGEMPVDDDGNERDRFSKIARNTHPTVKPTDLMRWLCRLVTPPGGTVLDPFMGSGSTGKSAVLEGFRFIGIEREAEYCDIARARIEAAAQQQDLFHAP